MQSLGLDRDRSSRSVRAFKSPDLTWVGGVSQKSVCLPLSSFLSSSFCPSSGKEMRKSLSDFFLCFCLFCPVCGPGNNLFQRAVEARESGRDGQTGLDVAKHLQMNAHT